MEFWRNLLKTNNRMSNKQRCQQNGHFIKFTISQSLSPASPVRRREAVLQVVKTGSKKLSLTIFLKKQQKKKLCQKKKKIVLHAKTQNTSIYPGDFFLLNSTKIILEQSNDMNSKKLGPCFLINLDNECWDGSNNARLPLHLSSLFFSLHPAPPPLPSFLFLSGFILSGCAALTSCKVV